MSKLIRRTKKNFGAALIIALQMLTPNIGRLADALRRWTAAIVSAIPATKFHINLKNGSYVSFTFGTK